MAGRQLTIKFTGAAMNYLNRLGDDDFRAILHTLQVRAGSRPDEGEEGFEEISGPSSPWYASWEVRGGDLYVIALGKGRAP